MPFFNAWPPWHYLPSFRIPLPFPHPRYLFEVMEDLVFPSPPNLFQFEDHSISFRPTVEPRCAPFSFVPSVPPAVFYLIPPNHPSSFFCQNLLPPPQISSKKLRPASSFSFFFLRGVSVLRHWIFCIHFNPYRPCFSYPFPAAPINFPLRFLPLLGTFPPL